MVQIERISLPNEEQEMEMMKKKNPTNAYTHARTPAAVDPVNGIQLKESS